MTIRVLLVVAYVVFFSIRAWKGKWYDSLLSLIFLMAFSEHPDMPKNMLGIQGLNFWNILFGNVFFAWRKYRLIEGISWDFPRNISKLLLLYMFVILIGTVRLFFDMESLYPAKTGAIIGDYFINTFKWLLPGVMLYDGARSRQRVQFAIAVILLCYVALALQVIRYTPLEYLMLSGDELQNRAARKLNRMVGYHRVNLSAMLGGACWAVVATLIFVKKWKARVAVIAVASAIFLGQTLTGGRTGYVTWGLVGLILCAFRWRKVLPLVPLVIVVALTFMPSVRERILLGLTQDKNGQAITSKDAYSMTSGRTLIWPYVIENIKERPLIGYGRQAMVRTGLASQIMDDLNESFPHPHNAYLELLLDNGVVGFVVIIPFYFVVVRRSVFLFKNRFDDLYATVGGVTAAIVLSQLISSMGSQTFYPRESTVGMWSLIFLMFRVYKDSEVSDQCEPTGGRT